MATLPKHSDHTTEAAIPHVTVTLIDANHCPGAAMLLLEGYFGVVLHTGDFRFDAERMGSHPALKGVSLDALYLDNTYGHPKFDLPTRLEAAAAVVHVIRQHPQHQIILGVDSLGKEELLHYLATYFGMPVRGGLWAPRAGLALSDVAGAVPLGVGHAHAAGADPQAWVR